MKTILSIRITCVILLVSSLAIGCKKDIGGSSPSKTPLAKTITDQGADSLITNIDSFYAYTQVVKNNPNAQPSFLPAAISIDCAVGYIENTFNSHFARLDYSLMIQVVDSFSFEVSLDADHNASTREIASSFNNVRGHIKSFYNSVDGEDKKLTIVDVEYNEDLQVMDVYTTVSYLPTTLSYTENLAFGTDDNWHIFHQWWNSTYGIPPGFIDHLGSYHPLTYGAPEVCEIMFG